MDSVSVLRIVHFILMVLAIAGLCLTSSIFDFIVSNRMYYTLPEKRVLIDESLWWVYCITATQLLIVSFCSLFFSQASQPLIDTARKYECLLGFLHGLSLLGTCLGGAVCCFKSLQTAFEIHPFAYNATPEQFEKASHWYYVRMVAATFVFGISALACLCEFLFLHCGLRLRQRSFDKLIPSPNQPAHQPGIIYFS
ncbi:unnamed protein product, partial [Mesorhabditis spiculigera]